MTIAPTVVLLVKDNVGQLAASDGIVYYLTPCCQASVTGTMAGDRPITGCRACYREVDDALGMAWLANDDQAWARYREQWMGRLGHSPTAGYVLDQLLATVRERAQVSA